MAFLRLIDQLAVAEMLSQIRLACELLGIDSEGPSCIDVALDVVGEEAFGGEALCVGDGRGVDAVIGFHCFFGIREGVGVKVVEDRITLAEPAEVQLIGV